KTYPEIIDKLNKYLIILIIEILITFNMKMNYIHQDTFNQITPIIIMMMSILIMMTQYMTITMITTNMIITIDMMMIDMMMMNTIKKIITDMMMITTTMTMIITEKNSFLPFSRPFF